jgi:hypothetical protein
MTPELEALGRRAVACKGFRWMPGMADCWGGRVREGDGLDRASAFPDFTDAATLGCLLALVREAFTSADRLWGGRVEVHQDSHCLFVVVRPEHDPNGFLYHRWVSSGESEIEALVVALEVKETADIIAAAEATH